MEKKSKRAESKRTTARPAEKVNPHDLAMREAGYLRATAAAKAAGVSKSSITVATRDGKVRSKFVGSKSLYVHWGDLVRQITGGDAHTQRVLKLNPDKLPT